VEIEKYFSCVDETAGWLEKKIEFKPEIVVVLSGGLSNFLSFVEDKTTISLADIPNFPATRVEGHAGQIIFGKFADVGIAVMSGRYHHYEGYGPQTIVFPYFVLNKLGAKSLVTTNAVGGINKKYKPGDVMMVTDHINMMGINPLVGITVQKPADQFPSMTSAYHPAFMDIARLAAKRLGMDLQQGVYLATSGPSYETKSEIKVYRSMGADAVGMSTVPEVIAAAYLKMKVLTFSCIANQAADLHEGEMSHKEVLNAMNLLAPDMVRLLVEVVKDIAVISRSPAIE
jgi:purine-nucleoside phosphorylase